MGKRAPGPSPHREEVFHEPATERKNVQRIVTAKLLWGLAWALLLAGSARAQVSETILAPSGLTNYTGYVIDADANTNAAAFNREALLFHAIVRSTNSGATTMRSNYYVFRLLDTNNTPFPIYDAGGNINGGLTYNLTNANVVLANNTAITRTNLAVIRPAARLNPYNQYTLEMRIFTNGLPTGRATNDGLHSYHHFTNLVSGDPSFNVLLTLDSVTDTAISVSAQPKTVRATREDVARLLRV